MSCHLCWAVLPNDSTGHSCDGCGRVMPPGERFITGIRSCCGEDCVRSLCAFCVGEAVRTLEWAAQKEREELKVAPVSLPVDRSQRELVSGKKEAEMPDYRELKPSGQQKDYVVLTEEERAKGFVRPVRCVYIHRPLSPESGEGRSCGGQTTMALALAETYARDPKFYSHTFCVHCKKHFPVNEFVWEDGTRLGT